MKGGFCPKCDDYSFDLNKHTCPPAYEVIFYDSGEGWEDAQTVYADSHEKAAEKATDIANCRDAEYSTREKVCVRKVGESEVKVFTVYVDFVPEYKADADVESEVTP